MSQTEPTQAVKEMTRTLSLDQLASINAFIDVDIAGEVVKLQLTGRHGVDAKHLAADTESVINALTIIRANHPRPVRPSSQVVTDAPGETSEKKKYEPRPVPYSDLPEGLPEGEYFRDDFDYFVVEPQPDEKCTIKFYKDSLKFPVGAAINKWKNTSAQAAMNHLVSDFKPTVANKYRVAGYMLWTKGNEYTIASGQHQGEKSNYKDFRAAYQTL